MKLALREELTPGESLPEKLAWLERHGLDGIELSRESLELPPAELESLFAGAVVRPANVSGSTKLLNPDPTVRATARDLVRRRLELAGRLGAAGVLLVPQFGEQPALPDLAPFKTGAELEYELLLAQLRMLADDATRAGTSLFIEPLNRYEAHLVNRLDQAVAIATEVGPGIAVMADFFHMNIEEADIGAAIRAAGSQIVHVHVADSNRLQPGRGHLDFRPGFSALKEIGYTGFVGIECRVVGAFDEAMTEAAAYLRAEWATA